jgi:hypothetical protein
MQLAQLLQQVLLGKMEQLVVRVVVRGSLLRVQEALVVRPATAVPVVQHMLVEFWE